MPVIKVSNETYQALLRKQAEDGNAMSVVMDRLMASLKELEIAKVQGSKRAGSVGKRAGSKSKRNKTKRNPAKTRALGIEGLAP